MQAKSHEEFHAVDSSKTAQGSILWKFRENYKGLEVIDASLTVETDSVGRYTGDAQGTFIEGIEEDLPTVKPLVTKAEAFFLCMKQMKVLEHRDQIPTYTADLKINTDKFNVARLAYFVQFLLENKDILARPTCLIDGNTGETVHAWDSLETKERLVEGVGGNVKSGKVRYGKNHKHLKAKQIGNTCYLENDYVKVINMNFTQDDSITETISFPCDKGYNDSYDGSYSAALDAFYNGNGVYNMFKEWFNMEPLKLPITLRVHYGESLESAFWNGDNCSFGDGSERFYALTAMDVMAHELAHGFTERHSGLYYFDQPGSIDESFSDITGEVAEAYLYGNDWYVGKEIMRKVYAFRYFDDPHLDGLSIDHVDNYTDGINVHFGSGVMNKAFYEIVHGLDMDVKDAYSIFLLANRLYWYHFTTYEEAGCDLMKAAYDLGFDPLGIQQSLQKVGINGCDVSRHALTLRRNYDQKGFVITKTKTPIYAINSPYWAINITVIANSKMGPIKLLASNNTWPTKTSYDYESEWNGEAAVLTIAEPPTGRVYVMLTSPSEVEIEDGSLLLSYDCGEGDWMDGAFFLDCIFGSEEFR